MLALITGAYLRGLSCTFKTSSFPFPLWPICNSLCLFTKLLRPVYPHLFRLYNHSLQISVCLITVFLQQTLLLPPCTLGCSHLSFIYKVSENNLQFPKDFFMEYCCYFLEFIFISWFYSFSKVDLGGASWPPWLIHHLHKNQKPWCCFLSLRATLMNKDTIFVTFQSYQAVFM